MASRHFFSGVATIIPPRSDPYRGRHSTTLTSPLPINSGNKLDAQSLKSYFPRLHLIRDLRTNRIRSPELNQRAVQVQPFPTNRFLDRVYQGGSICADGDLLKVFGFDSLKRHVNSMHVWTCAPKHQVFEFCGGGEVKRGRRCEIAGLSCTKCSVSAEHTCDDEGVRDPTMETLVRQKGDRTLFES